MSENFEFDDVKKVRKSLLIISVVGIILKKLIKYSTGNIEFLGFSIPFGEADFLTHLVSFIIVFYIFAFVIRTASDKFPNYYIKSLQKYDISFALKSFSDLSIDTESKNKVENKLRKISKVIKIFTTILDFAFPIGLAVFSLVVIYCN
ncbi:hypothetical protein SAMN06265371_101266 [Lutibacter agarilyticus]|uniref:Uncharacterized protein n=1 Tax=Lutibacter agarilyticus TaxID=1109740 RepID=A0A238VFU4_9FLAO|nr:hypothetical protein [Lutibacter agarilyticus]SNR32389.1 hypothetical protein SAMN06265371_101266 [Lutibacter agarilyticus]